MSQLSTFKNDENHLTSAVKPHGRRVRDTLAPICSLVILLNKQGDI